MRFRQLKKGSFSQTREATIRLGVRDGWVSVLINKEPAQLNLFGPSIRKDLRTFSFGRGKRKKGRENTETKRYLKLSELKTEESSVKSIMRKKFRGVTSFVGFCIRSNCPSACKSTR